MRTHRQNIFRLLLAVALSIGTVRAAPPVIELVGPVGPATDDGLPAGSGTVRVYTETYEVAAGRDGSAVKFPHSGYVILDGSGRVLQHVDNHRDNFEAPPTNVPLPAGRYAVKALCATYGTVVIPVQIVAGKCTRVYLTAGGFPTALAPPGSDLVRLPNGLAIGVRAAKPRPPRG